MYKLLLSWRYLRTRFIALASIVSVTLGVATMIVVNSVMSGFVSEMRSRLHGVLSDIDIRSPGFGEIRHVEEHLQVVQEVVGDDLEAATCVVQMPALLNFRFRGQAFSQPVVLIGVDEPTFSRVCEFQPFLGNERNRQQLSFELKTDGYDARFGESGWNYRRDKEENRIAVDRLLDQVRQQPSPLEPTSDSLQQPTYDLNSLPEAAPDLNDLVDGDGFLPNTNPDSPRIGLDPHAGVRTQLAVEDMFNPMNDQYTGLIMGGAIAMRRFLDPEDEKTLNEVFLIRPGDDVQLNLMTVGDRPTPIAENFTVVDLYSSNMHEYDSSFCFVPLSRLQKLTGMVDPLTGEGAVSAIQIRLKEGADLTAVRDRLISRFPPDIFPYSIQTWEETQAPLLSAVNMELTILNILLFLIIAVAGFGILATFFMIVVEKTRDIGILKALGAPSTGVMSIFLGYGLSLGTVGAGVGTILGLLFVWNINTIAHWIELMTGREVFDPTIYYFSEIPTVIVPSMVIAVGLGAMAIAVLASVLPALRAARLHPVEALRYE